MSTGEQDDFKGVTVAGRRVGGLVIIVHSQRLAPSDPDWEECIELCKRTAEVRGSVAMLVVANEAPPNAKQRSVFNRELANVPVRIAVLGVKPHLMPVVKVFSWFTGIQAFDRNALERALAFVETGTDLQTVTEVMRELEHHLGVAAPA